MRTFSSVILLGSLEVRTADCQGAAAVAAVAGAAALVAWAAIISDYFCFLFRESS